MAYCSKDNAKCCRCLALPFAGVDDDEPAVLRHQPDFRLVWIKINLKKINKIETVSIQLL